MKAWTVTPFYLDLSDRDVRDVLWLLASRWEEFRPDDTRTLRCLVGEHSTADECRERLGVGPEPDDPLPDEIAGQAEQLRQGWKDGPGRWYEGGRAEAATA